MKTHNHNVLITIFIILCIIQVFQLPGYGAEKTKKYKRVNPRMEEIKPPDWVYDHVLKCSAGHINKDLKASLDKAAALGATMVNALIFAHGQDTWHNSNLQPKNPKLGDVDYLKDYIEGAHKRNMKAIGTVQMSKNKWYLTKYPNHKLKKEENIDNEKETKGCWHSPFGQYMIDFLVDIAKNYNIDGFSSDGFCARKICYCDYTRKLYKKETGRDLPKKVDIDDPEYRDYIPWRDRKFNEYVYKLNKSLKKVRKDLILAMWYWGEHRWHYWPFRHCGVSVLHQFDMPMLEMFWNWNTDKGNNLPANFAFKWQVGAGRDHHTSFAPAHKGHGMERMRIPEVEGDFRIYATITAIAGGGNIMTGTKSGSYKSGTLKDIKRIGDLVTERKEWLARAKPLKYAAIVYSQDTALYFATKDHNDTSEYFRGNMGLTTAAEWKKITLEKTKADAYLYNCYGAFRAITEEHLPVDIIQECDVEDGFLKDYKVVILPNTAILSDKACEEIRKYVKNGGGLVATYLTSMSDPDGNLLKDFHLADMFKVSFKGIENRTKENKTSDGFIFLDHEINSDKVIKESHVLSYPLNITNTPYIGKIAAVEAKPEANVFIKRRAGKKLKKGVVIKEVFKYPAGISTKYGKGKVVYFPAAIGHSYFSMPIPYERKLLVNAVKYVATGKSPVEVKAPMCIYSAYGIQKKNNRTIVHLLNEINTSGKRALSVGDIPVREEIIPISGIEILFRDKGIKTVSIQPGNKKLKITKAKDGILVKVPPVELHSMIVAER